MQFERRHHGPEVAIRRPVMMMESGPVGGIIASAEVGRRSVIRTSFHSTWAAPRPKPAWCSTARRLWPKAIMSRLHQRRSGHGAGRRCRGSRHRRGSIACARRRRCPQGRSAERRRQSRANFSYARGGTTADNSRRQRRVGAAWRRGLPRRRDAPRCRRCRGGGRQTGRAFGPRRLGYRARHHRHRRSPRCRSHVRECRSSRVHDPRDFALVASGGAGPLHAVPPSRAICAYRR